jgi:hypothetical protein
MARAELELVMAAQASALRLCLARSATADKTPEVHTARGVLGSLDTMKSLGRYERRALTRWLRSIDEFQNALTEKGGLNYRL